MFLRNVKIAGFKSFADPVHIAFPGKLLGVVGPNGCGKSNVVDAVRWVLGESQARHLRGETMQDVIFNGTTERAAVGRASVELMFDNSLGRAGGQWQQYAELSVKRVLERDGESSYYINNQHVRRRDVQDIFLGTGLGPRAYAIIEQGMISRVVESKPEELRVFLEEAAGVSKYKERRRETGLRLADTRSNLARTHDILQELDAQLVRLDEQCKIARQFQELQSQTQLTQNLLWYMRKRDAGNARERHNRELARVQNELEQEIARVREAERELEQARQEHYQAGDALHTAQGQLYTINAEVARLQQQLQFVRDQRRRIEQQLAQLDEQRVRTEEASSGADQRIAALSAELAQFNQALELCAAQSSERRNSSPIVERSFQAANEALQTLRADLAKQEQQLGIAQANRSHAQKTLEQLAARQARLLDEQQDLVAPDRSRLDNDRAALGRMDAQIEALRSSAAALNAELEQVRSEREELERGLEERNTRLTKLEAQKQALQALQAKLVSDERVQHFLREHGLQHAPRLWHSINVEQGWEDALEAALGLRLNAVGLERLQAARELPTGPAGVTMFASGSAIETTAQPSDTSLGSPLLNLVSVADEKVRGVLRDWLAGAVAIEDWRDALERVQQLAPGGMFVSRDGHIITAHSISFFAPNAEVHGVLARRREIDELSVQHVVLTQEVEIQRAALTGVLARQETLGAQLKQSTAQQAQLQTQRHDAQVEMVRLTELAERIFARAQQLEAELSDVAAQFAADSRTLQDNAALIDQYGAAGEQLRGEVQRAQAAYEQANSELNRERSALQAAERAEQEARYRIQSCQERLANQQQERDRLTARTAELASQRAQLSTELEGLDETPHQSSLNQSLSQREGAEQALAAARNQVETLAARISEIDAARLQAEQKLEPLREAINEVRLKEQEARLAEAQFAEQLAGANADEAQLAGQIEKGVRSSHLQNELNRLQAEIQALGLVNLAAVSEFEAAQQRKTYLDAQVADLTEAVETLENAIRRIDRETRELLRETFERVNTSFSEMFPQLFGGGRASITLTGEEILDAGLEIHAQPPGKKTNSIHLLSGGEKALTAISLVFSLFQLNPAPFCILDEVDAPLDDANTERFCELVKRMAHQTQFLFISHNKLTMEMAEQLIGITMQESGVSRVVAVDIDQARRLSDENTAKAA